MPALKPTDYFATITWVGMVPTQPDDIRSASASELSLTFDGPQGEAHAGRTRPSCVRVKSQHPEGTEIANVRQLTVLSAEEIAEIAVDCGMDDLDPIYLGATLVIEGIADFTHVPPSSRLQAENGTCIVIDMENRPCNLPAREIEKDQPGRGKPFKQAATGKRGVTAWVERPGVLRIGDQLRLHIPDQRPWKMPVD